MADSPYIRALIIGIFLLILMALGSAFLSLFRNKDPDGTATVKALTVRVGLSVGLILTLIILNALGIISPNG